MSKEYTFWFHVMRKSALAFPWNMPKQLVKVVVRDNNIISDGSIWMGSQGILEIALADIAQIKLSISATAPNGGVEIITQNSIPTLLSHSNVDEIMAFISIVEALKNHRDPEFDENPYIRQTLKRDKPAYLNNQKDFVWDKNVSPWNYYHEFVPASVDKKKHAMARVYKIITLSALSIIVLLAIYAIYVQFVW